MKRTPNSAPEPNRTYVELQVRVVEGTVRDYAADSDGPDRVPLPLGVAVDLSQKAVPIELDGSEAEHVLADFYRDHATTMKEGQWTRESGKVQVWALEENGQTLYVWEHLSPDPEAPDKRKVEAFITRQAPEVRLLPRIPKQSTSIAELIDRRGL